MLFDMVIYYNHFIFCLIVCYAFRQGTTSHDSYSEDMYRKLLESYQQLDQEMNLVAVEWLECEKRIDNYVDEQVGYVNTDYGTVITFVMRGKHAVENYLHLCCMEWNVQILKNVK